MLVDGPEAIIARIFFGIIKAANATLIAADAAALLAGDPPVPHFTRCQLVENQLYSDNLVADTLYVGIFPVKVNPKPSQRDDLVIELHIAPVLAYETDGKDQSDLILTNWFNWFRILLSTTATPIVDGAGNQLTYAYTDYRFKATVYPEVGLRAGDFVFLLQTSIDPTTGAQT